jgi:hypothetical protein
LFLLSGNGLLDVILLQIHTSEPFRSFLRSPQEKAVGRRRILAYLSRVERSGVFRRRRLVALLVASVVVYLLYANAGAEAGTPPVSYTVEHGDTLWGIATEHYPPSDDPRTKIEAIREENGLEGYIIEPGTRLELPR